MEKAMLYAGESSDTFSHEEHRELLAAVENIARETDSEMMYEGRSGASPRGLGRGSHR